MATDKPRLSISMDEKTYKKVLAYKEEKGIATQSKAIIEIMEMGIDEIEREIAQKNPPSVAEAARGSVLRSTLLHNFDQLNQEGQEQLVDHSDTMVTSGKYIKSNPNKLGKTKDA